MSYEGAGWHNLRETGTVDQMGAAARGLIGRRVRHADLAAAGPVGMLAAPEGEPW